MRNIPIIIPAYEPDERMIELINHLNREVNSMVIIVNDGSGSQYNDIFERAGELIAPNGGIVLTHDVNKGKGRALKTAFAYVLENIPEALGVVTADSDGQHTTDAINNVIDSFKKNPDNLVLGVRVFTGDDVPWKSRFGNTLTENVFKYVSGVHVTDTQTGLRGISREFMKELLDVAGERFEFEMRMLLVAAGRYDITEVPIETIYDSVTDHQTHFNPIKDSIRIYKILGAQFFKFIFASLSSSLIDLALFAIVCAILKKLGITGYIAIATVVARVISATYNYVINYKAVFKSKENVAASAIKYVILSIVQMSASALLVTVFAKLLGSVNETIIKMLVDLTLFFFSYTIQNKYVFKKNLKKL